ncbi:MAG: hypothetical protein LC104_05550 [Bacteroidales bacterium]|nr:hypothetical protein [Bacteroidales bacterium]
MEHPAKPSDAEMASELARVKAEPLLPAEKWLIGGSVSLGILLLLLLLWVSRVYFPVEV